MTEYRHPGSREIPALRKLWRDAFGESEEFVDWFMSTAYSPNRCLVALDGSELLGALYWFDCRQGKKSLAYLYGVATAPGHRNRGVASELMHRAHGHLQQMGYAGAVLVPGGPELFRFYERLGYTTAGFLEERPVKAGLTAPIREITPGEYGALRRELLPAGGVLQEGENLDFLYGLARLWAGDGFIAAVSRGENPLVLELLGNPEAAPGLLGALGIDEAAVRMPGGKKPFAMLRPFSGEWEPFWFGLAFD